MKTNKKIGTLALCVLLSLLSYNSLLAQQTATFSDYNFNPFIINSAYAGFYENAELTISNSGFGNTVEGSPQTLNFSYNTPLNRGKVGLGAGFIQDEIGVTSSTHIFGAYSYKIFFDFKNNRPQWQIYSPGVLSFGISGGVQLFRDNLLELGIPDDPRFQENINATIPTIGVGIMFNYDRFFVGASTSNVLGDRFASDDNLELSVPYYGYFGYQFYTNLFKKTVIKPNILLKTEKGAPLQADLNIAIRINEILELGGGYRTNSSLNFLIGLYAIKNLRFIYNYNYVTNDAPIGNTHGLQLNYRFGKGFN